MVWKESMYDMKGLADKTKVPSFMLSLKGRSSVLLQAAHFRWMFGSDVCGVPI